jgi:hypothetical protein
VSVTNVRYPTLFGTTVRARSSTGRELEFTGSGMASAIGLGARRTVARLMLGERGQRSRSHFESGGQPEHEHAGAGPGRWR